MTPQILEEKLTISPTGLNFGLVDYSSTFHWIEKEFVSRLNISCEEFFCNELKFYLLAACTKPGNLLKGEDYFVSQIELAQGVFCHLRLSEDAIDILLETAFGKYDGHKSFVLKKISELEARIMTAFNKHFLKSSQDLFLPAASIKTIPQQKLETDVMHLVLYVQKKDSEESGKIIISFPLSIMREPEKIDLSEETLDLSFFDKSLVKANIAVGSTKIFLNDLKNLESEDIIVLENSNIHSMKLLGSYQSEFSITPDPNLVINIDGQEDEEVSQETASTQDMWDNIQIEVGAQFEKVKMSLGELRHISEGLVIDVAPITKNKVFLQVEEKHIAAGELVIVGDRFGVKLTEVYQEDSVPQPEAEVEQPEDQEMEAETTDVTDDLDDLDDDDFDYSDFEIDDDI